MDLQEWDDQDQPTQTAGDVVRSANRNFLMKARLIIAFIVVFAIGLALGIFIGTHYWGTSVVENIPLIGSGLDATPDENANLTDFWEVWNALNTNYVVTHASSTIPTTQAKVWGAIEGLTSSYGDPYTVFFPPTQAQQFQDNIQGSFDGVGMELGENSDGVLEVIAPLKGTPADKAGIESGDLVAAINGKTTEGLSPDDAVNAIRGPKGTVVDFTIVRAGKEIDIKVTRDTIQVPDIEYGLNKTTGVYNIALFEFTENSADLFQTAYTAFLASGSKDLVIDLRGNPGGYLTAAVAIAGDFLPKGAVVVTEDYEGHQQNIVSTSAGPDNFPAGDKLVVLIDSGSASASEILSGALKDHGVAELIGSKSFGKGSVQELINIDGGSLKVTVARWLTPAGINIMVNGITPDIYATTTPADISAGNDPGMARAVQYFQTGN
jgi:carboxyl-terminal processing protease